MREALWLALIIPLVGPQDKARGPTFLEAMTLPAIAAGDDEAILTAWKGILEEAPGSPCAEMILRDLIRRQDRFPNLGDLRPTLEILRGERRDDGVAPALAATLLAEIYSKEGNDGQVQRMAQELGLVRSVLFAGPFGHARGALHDHAFPPEEDINTAAPSVETRYSTLGGDVEWRLLPPPPGLRALLFSPFLRRSAGAIYVVAQVKVGAPTPAAIVLSSRSSLKVWLNGSEVADVDRSSGWVPSGVRVGVTLQPGWNRIGVKVAPSGRPQVQLRVTDPTGYPIPDLEVCQEAVFHPLPDGAAGTEPVDTATGADGAYRTELQDSPDSADGHLGLGTLLWRAGVAPEAEEHLARAVELSPDSPHLRSLFADFLQQAPHLPSTVRKNRAQGEYTRALEADPVFTPAAVGLANILSSDGKAEEAITLLQRVLKAHPKAHAARYVLHEIALREKWTAEAEAAARQIEADRPDWRPIREFWARRYRGRGNLEASTGIYRKIYEADRRQTGAALAVADFEEARGRHEEAAEIYSNLAERAPNDTSLLWSMLETQFRARQYDRALDSARRVAEIQPWNGRALEKAGHVCRRKGDREAAIRWYEEALKTDPSLHRVRRLLDHLHDRPDVFDVPYDPDVGRLIDEAPGPEAYPKAKVLGILDHTVLRIYEDGSASEIGHTATKVLTEEGKEEVKTRFPRGEVLEIRTITPEGRVLEPIKTSTGGGFHLPGLEPGAIVEAKWRRDHGRPSSVFGWGPFYFQDPQYEEPFLLSRFVLIVPKDYPLETLQKNLPFEPQVSETGEDKVIIYEARDMKRVEPENWMPETDEILPFVRLYQNFDWADINDRYRDRILGRKKLTRALREAAAAATEGIQGDLEKARTLYRFVNETIKRRGSAGDAHQVLLEKAGDRSILYMALLDASGIPYDTARARMSRQFTSEADWEVVDGSQFYASFLRIRPAHAPPVWLSMDSRFYPFGFVPLTYQGGEVFVTSEWGGEFTVLPEEDMAAQSASGRVEIRLKEGGGMTCVLDGTERRAQLYSIKESLEETPDDDRERILQQIVNQRFPGASMTQGEFPELTTLGMPFRYRIEAEVPKFVEERGDGWIMPTGLDRLQLARGFLGRMERNHPIVVRQVLRKDDDVAIEMGPYSVVSLPPNRLIKSRFGAYSITYRQPSKDRIEIRRRFHLLPFEEPPEAYASFVEFCQKVDEADDRPVTVSP